MRILFITLTACSALLASCASSNTTPAPSASPSANDPVRFVLRNDSTSTLTIQPFESVKSGGIRQPFGNAFTIAPGQSDSRDIGIPGKVVTVTIKASGQDIKYQSGEWIVTERAGGFRLYAFTDGSQTVRVYWNGRSGEEINMQ